MKLSVSQIADLYNEYEGLRYVKGRPVSVGCIHEGGAQGLIYRDSGKTISEAVAKEFCKQVAKRMREIESIFEYNELEIDPSPETSAEQK